MPIEVPVEIEALDNYAAGEIFWSKAVGRPETNTLSEGFNLEASQETWLPKAVPPDGIKWERLPLPRNVTWWDGREDEDYWRVNFWVASLERGETTDPRYNLYTYILPTLVRTVRWTYPGGRFGIASQGRKTLEPPGAHFVKRLGVVRPAFEVVIKAWWNP